MRRHRFDALSFVFALLFAALGLAALLEVQLRPVSAAWAGPVVLILLGLVLLAGALARAREPEPDGGSERVAVGASSTADDAAGSPSEGGEPAGDRPGDDDTPR